MSERILKALMQLFAIIADPKSNTQDRRPVVESFLKNQLNSELVDEYLGVFDYYYAIHQQKNKSKIKSKKRTSSSSVRVLMICTEINKELTQKQKIIVVIRLLEFINSGEEITKQEHEFVSTVANTFNIKSDEYEGLKDFALEGRGKIINSAKTLIIDSEKSGKDYFNHIYAESLVGKIIVYSLNSVNMHVFIFTQENELYLNNQLLEKSKIHILSQGSSIKNNRIKPIYYSDIISAYNIDKLKSQIAFEANKLTYKFQNGVAGLQNMSFVVQSGNLVGIMGASGSGKSTLINVLNGNLRPNTGEVLINGINIHKKPDEIEGIIGYVSQDDILIEELTVFQNLYYNAKFCYDNYSERRLIKLVLRLLKNLGLYEIKNMKVGSPLDKKISGGQRKRLNIALELIREPSILFLDEPTSGLSSRDSENIIDLLKELALKGKLVFIVIHQPSSDIFKRFDKLLVLDQGGYLIYQGDPVESISYFKSCIRQADWNESECSVCGNVNPEQIFNILEAQVVDEFGNLTQSRKIFPNEWEKYFTEYDKKTSRKKIFVKKLPEVLFKIPNKFKQIFIYLKRDLLSKLANKQYLIINFVEAPILAFMLAYIIRYYNVDSETNIGYNFIDNSNIPVYLFMSVIVAIFIGLSLSAQEIIKDRLIIKRESFLNLSRNSYLISKVVILSAIAAYQSLIFVLIGNSIIEIKGMIIQYWAVLFSTWIASIMLGLIISDSFKSTVTIYIIIPFLIIPQIILSGIIVPFDKLNPQISTPSKVPFYGEIMFSRWAYEALAVYQFKNNDYEKLVYIFDKEKSIARYKRDYWYTKLNNKLEEYKLYFNDKTKKEKLSKNLILLKNEIIKELEQNADIELNIDIFNLDYEKINASIIDSMSIYLKNVKDYYNFREIKATRLRDKKIDQIKKEIGKKAFNKLKSDHYNTRLSNFVKNNTENVTEIVEYEGRLYQKIDPVFNLPESNFIKAHFYSPAKRIFGKYINTIWVNIIVLWFLIILMYIVLYNRSLLKVLNLYTYIKGIITKDKIEY
ncbi:MAG: ATP-binding cassette domain-containing protein [Bacteroidales bacterium]|nr:ATP-binding cassette domain-containing protein [Bacteroidales bacterium]